MTEHISRNERGVVRVFAVDLDPGEQAAFVARNTSDGQDIWPVRDALGVPDLDPKHIEIFPVADLADIGVAGYLADGYAIPVDSIEKARPALDAMTGHAVLVWSRAFRGVETDLGAKPPLRLVATLQEPQPDVRFEQLPDDSAKSTSGKPSRKPVSDAAMSGRIAMIALIVAFGVVGLMIWVGAR